MKTPDNQPERPSAYTSQTPFDNIESSHYYVHLLLEAVEEAAREVKEEIDLATAQNAEERQKDALRITAYNLAKLALHMKAGGRILNDLRTLRRLLSREREGGTDNSAVAVRPEDYECDFTIKFSPDISPTQVKLVLTALSDFYRACEGVGFRIQPEVEEVLVRARVPANV